MRMRSVADLRQRRNSCRLRAGLGVADPLHALWMRTHVNRQRFRHRGRSPSSAAFTVSRAWRQWFFTVRSEQPMTAAIVR